MKREKNIDYQKDNSTQTLLETNEHNLLETELERILSNPNFKASKRLRQFLKFITLQKLRGDTEQIKAYTIAIEVFDRNQNFNPTTDPIVRVEAGRLRRALEHFYLTCQTKSEIRIEIPIGSYIPEIIYIDYKANNYDRRKEDQPGALRKADSRNTPSLVIYPFTFQGENTEYSYIASGLGEEISIALTRIKELRVFPGGLLPEPYAKTPDLQKLNHNLNIRFVLTGSVCLNGNNLRVNIQLFDTNTTEQIWAERYTYTSNHQDILSIQLDISRKVLLDVADFYDGIIPRILSKESEPATQNLTSYEAILRIHHYHQTLTNQSYLEARESLEKAIIIDPQNALAWASYAEIYTDGYTHNFLPQNRDLSLKKSFESVRHAISLDPGSDYPWWVLGHTAIVARDKETVLAAVESLFKLNPPPSTLALGAWLLALVGQWQRGLSLLSEQLDIMRFYPGWFHHVFFLDYYQNSDYENALIEANKMNIPVFLWDPVERCAALGQLGYINEAASALDEVLALRPDFSDNPRRYLDCYIFQDELVVHVLDGLYKAGLPHKE